MMLNVNTHKKRYLKTALAIGLFSSIALVPGSPVMAFEESSNHWAKYDASSSARVEHRPMTSILEAISVRNSKQDTIAYSAIKGQTLSYVKSYIRYLENIKVSTLNRDEQLAYWLNLHNIGVIKLLAEEKRGYRKVKKYRGTPGKPGSKWSEKIFSVEGQELSLEQIEQEILFANWKDPLILYGLCYGTQGSPSIGKVAFTGRTVKAQLAENARKFINSTKNVKVSKKGAQVSSLYTWNKASLFDGDDQLVLAHLKSFAKPRLEKKLAAADGIYKDRFSWKSNAYVPRAQAPAGGGFGGGGGGGGGGGYGGGS
ncbi:DUF547 domain-containing protein [Kordiimonas sp. SCSIO 12610]|uniref:DUF547 domain-containing protein n=1 Tax=Kordiimonas sp. SCSIO 12610 TaxID=2829597 RepID=UPI00210EAA11|nr:DUF547 domain-containing protein [Kordiimonas sp. SCSIO 12610]UTW55916.1 DUF547 domain-containing protein [Kordiimonas sp. SCSIO 12610]